MILRHTCEKCRGEITAEEISKKLKQKIDKNDRSAHAKKEFFYYCPKKLNTTATTNANAR